MFDKGELLSRRERESTVWLYEGVVYKHAPKYLIDTEHWFLTAMETSGYVPAPVRRMSLEVLAMPYIVNEHVDDPKAFFWHYHRVLGALHGAGCRHGDLTSYAVLVSNNKPILIDFGESRHRDSPLPDKRPEGDEYWLLTTMWELAYGTG